MKAFTKSYCGKSLPVILALLLTLTGSVSANAQPMGASATTAVSISRTSANWLSGFGNRKSLTITGSPDGIQTNYQLKLTVHKGTGTDSGSDVFLGNKVKADFSDIRFTKNDGTTLLDYWVESYVENNSAVVWVEFDSIPASPSTDNFHLYYENSVAASASNGNNTFIFFDDFSGDLSKWTIIRGNWGIESGTLRLTGDNDGEIIKPIGFSTLNDLRMQAKFNFSDMTWITYADLAVRSNDIHEAGYFTGIRPLDPDYGRWGLWYWMTNHWQNVVSGPSSYSNNTWYKMRIEAAGNSIRGYLNDTNAITTTNSLFSSGTAALAAHTQNGQYVYVDDFFIAKLCNSEPFISAWGAEETSNQPPTYQLSVNTLGTTGVNANSATLCGNLANMYPATSVMVNFNYGMTSSMASSTPPLGLTGPSAFGTPLSDLTSNTTYYFRAVASDGNQTVYGGVLTFRTQTDTQSGVSVTINAPPRVPPNTNFTVSVDIANVTAFDSASYDINYNSTLFRFDGVTAGDINGTAIPVDLYNQVNPQTCTIVQNLPGLTGVSGSGRLAVLHFRSIGASGTSGAINISNGALSDTEAREIYATWLGDNVEISVLNGDANGDGRVNAVDITKVERIIVRLDSPTSGADANADGKINAIDITQIERIIAGLP